MTHPADLFMPTHSKLAKKLVGSSTTKDILNQATSALGGRLGDSEDAVINACREYVASEDALPDEFDSEDYQLSKAVESLVSHRNELQAAFSKNSKRADFIIQDILQNHLPRVVEGLEKGYIDENQILVIYDHAVRARILKEMKEP